MVVNPRTEQFLEKYRQRISNTLEVPKKEGDGTVKHLRDIEIRQDFLFMGYSTILSPQRAERPNKPLESGVQSNTGECIFCPGLIEKVTPLPRKYHDKLITFPSESETKVNGKTITVPNLYPFASPHWVTVFSTHKPDLSKLDYSDMTNYFESGYEILTEIEKNGAHGVDGYWDIINWGNLAGASQVHPHAQRGGLLEKAITTLDSELEAYCSGAYKRMQSQDPFEEYMNIIRESDLVGWEDSYLFIHSPFAPKMSDQIDIILKPKIHSLSELNEKERYHIARCMLGVFHMQYHQRKVKHLNVIMHQQRFSSREKTYRIHWHIIPRDKSLWGGMEMNEKYVVDVYPETTAAEIRKHYKT